MNRLHLLSAVLLLAVLLFALPFMVNAQEATSEATQAAPTEAPAPDVTVVVEAPASTSDSLNDAIPLIFGMVGMLWGIVATILNYKSIPVAQVTAFLNTLDANAKKTIRPEDDEAVRLAKTLWQTAQDLGLIKEAPVVTTTTTTTTSPIETEVAQGGVG